MNVSRSTRLPLVLLPSRGDSDHVAPAPTRAGTDLKTQMRDTIRVTRKANLHKYDPEVAKCVGNMWCAGTDSLIALAPPFWWRRPARSCGS